MLIQSQVTPLVFFAAATMARIIPPDLCAHGSRLQSNRRQSCAARSVFACLLIVFESAENYSLRAPKTNSKIEFLPRLTSIWRRGKLAADDPAAAFAKKNLAAVHGLAHSRFEPV